MKRYTILLAVLFCVCSLSAQKTVFYFGENKKKIQFETIDTLSYVLFKASVTDMQKRAVMRNNRKNIPLKGRSMLLGVNSESEITQLRSDNSIEAVYRMLCSEDGDIHVLRGEILVKINPEENVESVFNRLNIPYISEEPIEGLKNVFLVCIPSPDQTLDVVNKLTTSESVIYAEPNFITFTEVPIGTAVTDNYHLRQSPIRNAIYEFDINVLPAWKISKGENIKVAVLDLGVDLEHPDLKDNLLPGYDTTDWEGNRGNGSAGPNEPHGTACTGIIAAVENGFGITGIAPKCKIIPVRIAEGEKDYSGEYYWKTTSIRSIASGFIKAYQNGADVLSCSFGLTPGYAANPVIKDAIAEATTQGRNRRGSVVVFSTGNESANSISSYGFLDNVISVGAIDENGQRADFSNYGNGLKVVAPGVDTPTLDMHGSSGYVSGDYCYFSGTSAACPHVAGIAALLLSIKPDAQASSVISWICSSCKKLPAYQYSVKDSYGTWNNETGYGLVDAYGAIAACNPPFTLNVPDIICDCETYTFSVSGPTERCDSIVWDLGTSKNIVSGNGVNSVEARIDYESGCSVPLRASLYYGDKRPIEVEAWAHSGVPETYEITGYDEATAWEYMYVEAIMEGATSYTWTLEKGNCGIWPNGNTAQIMPYDTNPVTICVTGHNQCGSWSEWFNFIPDPRSYMKSRQAVGAKAVAVYTLSYNLVYSDKNLVAPFDIKTTNLSPGFYIIEYQFEDGTATREKVYVP